MLNFLFFNISIENYRRFQVETGSLLIAYHRLKNKQRSIYEPFAIFRTQCCYNLVEIRLSLVKMTVNDTHVI